MAQTARVTKTYNGSASFTAGTPTVSDWNVDFDTLFAAYNAHDTATGSVHGMGASTLVGTDLTQTLTNKTLTTPTIADFTNAQHAHATAASGGSLSLALKNTVININDWNMDVTATVSVAHGLTLANIRRVTALIRDDSNTTYTSLEYGGGGSGGIDGYIYVNATNIVLTRITARYFDGLGFDATSYNRGWIVIEYV